jgi:hypothetical protein
MFAEGILMFWRGDGKDENDLVGVEDSKLTKIVLDFMWLVFCVLHGFCFNYFCFNGVRRPHSSMFASWSISFSQNFFSYVLVCSAVLEKGG